MPVSQLSVERPKSLADVKAFGYRGGNGGAPAFDLPPLFIVIGAPRCGSTSVCRTLKRHPAISFSFPKETHFLHRSRGERSLTAWGQEYVARHHPDLGPEHALMGDGSVSCMYAPETIERALEFDSRVRFIAVLRNPLEMIPSWYLRLRYTLDEDAADFETAWALQARRAEGRDVPPRCRDPRILQYSQLGKHAANLEKVFAIGGRERCLVVLFDDLRRDPRGTYLRLLEFIGVADDGQTEFRQKRETMAFRSRRLQRWLMNPPAWALRLIQSIDVKDVPRLKRLRKSLKRINNRKAGRTPLSPETRAMLQRHFADDVAGLSAMLGRDLRHWVEDGAGETEAPAAGTPINLAER